MYKPMSVGDLAGARTPSEHTLSAGSPVTGSTIATKDCQVSIADCSRTRLSSGLRSVGYACAGRAVARRRNAARKAVKVVFAVLRISNSFRKRVNGFQNHTT